MVLVIDNYDSFVYNLVRYLNELGHVCCIKRNDAIEVEEVAALAPSHIIISPGPCRPEQAGVSQGLIQRWGKTIPILGVCLGHQAIGQVYGGIVARAKRPLHGRASSVLHKGNGLFQGLNCPLRVARYHSLIVSDEAFPAELRVTARCELGEIMAIQHRQFPVFGVQFHPESILTEQGHMLLQNFLS